jgi:hypothetical protein
MVVVIAEKPSAAKSAFVSAAAWADRHSAPSLGKRPQNPTSGGSWALKHKPSLFTNKPSRDKRKKDGVKNIAQFYLTMVFPRKIDS